MNEDDDKKSDNWPDSAKILSEGADLISLLNATSRSAAEVTSPGTSKSLQSELELLSISSSLIDWDDYIKWDISHWCDWKSEVVGFKSNKVQEEKIEVSTSEFDTQTAQSTKEDVGVGDAGWADMSIQTDEVSTELEQRLNRKLLETSTPYPPSLYAFINRVGETMLRAVKENINPNENLKNEGKDEFLYEKPGLDEIREERFELLKSKAPSRIHRLRTTNLPHGVEALGVSWNPSGTQIVVAHGSYLHRGFCRHQAVPLTIWSLSASLLSKGPLHEILFDSCCTTVEFHPKVGNLIAFGFFTGEVGLIDLNGGDNFQPSLDFAFTPGNAGAGDSKSKSSSVYEFRHGDSMVIVNGSCHRQAVTTVQWIHLTGVELNQLVSKTECPQSYAIISTSLDGYIGFWAIDKISNRIQLERQFAVTSDLIPEKFKRLNRSTYMSMKEVGIRSWDSFKDDPTRFVCSTYGSFLFHGSLLGKSTVEATQLDHAPHLMGLGDIYEAGSSVVKQEQDYVQAVSANPFNPYLYAYVTQGGEVVLRNIKFNDAEPISRTYLPGEGTFAVKWSPIRPMVFGVGNNKKVFIFDLTVRENQEIFVLEHTAETRYLAWSKTDASYLAVADADGSIIIWKLPDQFGAYDYTELDQLNCYADFVHYTAPLIVEDTSKEPRPPLPPKSGKRGSVVETPHSVNFNNRNKPEIVGSEPSRRTSLDIFDDN